MMVRDTSDYQDNPASNTRAKPAGTSDKPETGRVERSGNEVRGEAPEAAPWYIANRVTPLDTDSPDSAPESSGISALIGDEKVPPQTTADEWRSLRYERRQQSMEFLIRGSREEVGLPPVAAVGEGKTAKEVGWIRPPRPARCSWRIEDTVGIHHSGDADQGAHWSGIERCGSVWACPVCAAVIRSERSRETQQGVETWQERGGSILFVTLTMRHTKSLSLFVSLNAALKAWQRLVQGKAWGKFKENYGVEGYVRAVEVTYGGQNGWHPHIHALLFLSRPLETEEVRALTDTLFNRWKTYVVKFGGGMPTRLRGIDVRIADKDGRVVAQYLNKLQDAPPSKKKNQIGKEMTRADYKEGRAGSLTPFELLDTKRREDELDDYAAYVLWNEYVHATKGRRAITWSRGLREELGLVEDRTDEEILEEVEQFTKQIVVPGPIYDAFRNQPAFLALILQTVEAGNIELALELTGGKTADEVEHEGYVPPPQMIA